MAGKYGIKDMARRLEAYLEENKDGLPILKECCLQNGWDYETVMTMALENKTLAKAINRLRDQKEVNLEKGGLFGNYNKPMAVALLKKELQNRENLSGAERASLEKLDALLNSDVEIAGNGDDSDCNWTDDENDG